MEQISTCLLQNFKEPEKENYEKDHNFKGPR